MNDWNPGGYLKFRTERTQPSIDLVGRISIDWQPKRIIDVGCGPGNSGQVLRQRWPEAAFLGIDRSEAMTEAARESYPDCEWEIADAATYESDHAYDIVFSNAVIQWIPDHDALFGQLRRLTSGRGVLAIQIPLFQDMPIGRIINRAAEDPRWRDRTLGARELFTYHDCTSYYDMLCERFASVDMWVTDYVHVLESQTAILDWTRSTGMKPFLDSLDNDMQREAFEAEVFKGVKQDYPVQHDGNVLFPFKRLFMVGYRA